MPRFAVPQNAPHQTALFATRNVWGRELLQAAPLAGSAAGGNGVGAMPGDGRTARAGRALVDLPRASRFRNARGGSLQAGRRVLGAGPASNALRVPPPQRGSVRVVAHRIHPLGQPLPAVLARGREAGPARPGQADACGTPDAANADGHPGRGDHPRPGPAARSVPVRAAECPPARGRGGAIAILWLIRGGSRACSGLITPPGCRAKSEAPIWVTGELVRLALCPKILAWISVHGYPCTYERVITGPPGAGRRGTRALAHPMRQLILRHLRQAGALPLRQWPMIWASTAGS
jgi:hypothetical protein